MSKTCEGEEIYVVGNQRVVLRRRWIGVRIYFRSHLLSCILTTFECLLLHTQVTRVLFLIPTWELAIQVHSVSKSLAKHTNFRLSAGSLDSNVQESALRRNPDIVVATSGKLIELTTSTLLPPSLVRRPSHPSLFYCSEVAEAEKIEHEASSLHQFANNQNLSAWWGRPDAASTVWRPCRWMGLYGCVQKADRWFCSLLHAVTKELVPL